MYYMRQLLTAHSLNMSATGLVFVPEQPTHRTPDISGYFNGAKFHCEVKTENESTEETAARRNGDARTIKNRLTAEYFGLLQKTMKCAEAKFDGLIGERHIFFILNFDDYFHEYLSEYFNQIRDWIKLCPQSYDRCWFWARDRFETRFSDSYELMIVDRETGEAK